MKLLTISLLTLSLSFSVTVVTLAHWQVGRWAWDVILVKG